ncbi:MAG: hypothetical protein RR338_02790 [Clostridia bacterium]
MIVKKGGQVYAVCKLKNRWKLHLVNTPIIFEVPFNLCKDFFELEEYVQNCSIYPGSRSKF